RLARFLSPETCARLTGHLRQAPARWAVLEGELPGWLASRAPRGPCADLAYGDAAVYLALELHAVRSLSDQDTPSEALERTLGFLSDRRESFR
ncbi:MAG: hypothetical protein QGG40_15865, partial [Myxococcota bacterium]|nr:hypothetical protein [Myxococcota bacterium]